MVWRVMNAELLLGLLIVVGFWAAVCWGAARWAKKYNRPVGRTVWQVILWVIVLSGVARVLQSLLGYKR